MSLKEIKQRFRKFTGIYKKNFLQLSQNQILSPLLKVFFVCKDEDPKIILQDNNALRHGVLTYFLIIGLFGENS